MPMQADQLKQSINRIEECADQAQRAVQSGTHGGFIIDDQDAGHQLSKGRFRT